MICEKKPSEVQDIMEKLPVDQGGPGRHKCAACAYEQGYQDGLNQLPKPDLDKMMEGLKESQAQAHRHKSPRAAYEKGYADGVSNSHKQKH